MNLLNSQAQAAQASLSEDAQTAPLLEQPDSTANPLPGFWQQIKEDWKAHGCDWTRPGFRAVAVHRFGVWCMQDNSLPQLFLRRLYWMLYRKIRNTAAIDLPHTAKLGRRVIVEHQGPIIIHPNSVIGDECILRQGVTLGYRHLNQSWAAPRLGQGVNTGAGAKILGAVTIGNHAWVGANAVVLQDVPDGCTAVGIPARVIAAKPVTPGDATGAKPETESNEPGIS